jgi:ribonuclease E
MPNNPRGGGVSRRIEGEDRQELREVMDQLDIPGGMSLIARTAGIGRSAEELQWDLNYLMQLWNAIDGAAKAQSGAFLIYQESSLVIRAIRDYFHAEIGEILIDTDDVFEQAQQFMSHVMPGNVSRVKRYHDDVPLFSRFQIEHQIESAYSRQVTLPSGGAVVIDHTEALVSVDVNSGRSTKGADIEETALRTNLEAADEIARQLRLRDLGGLIVIDFIDMESTKSQREVENRLRDALHFDRARVQTGKISRFGLLELSRQRLRPALAETSYITCPRCTGTGHIRSIESAALHILRILEEEAMKENTGALHVQVPVDVGTFLLNEKRVDIARIEMRHRVNLLIIPNRHLETPQHEIIRLRHDQLNLEGATLASYEMAVKPAEEDSGSPAQAEAKAPRAEAAVKGITPDQPAPIVMPKEPPPPPAEPGFFAKIMSWFTGDKQEEVVETPAKNTDRTGRRERGERSERNDRDRGGGGRGRREGREGRERNNERGERKERSETGRDGQKDNRQNRKERSEKTTDGRRESKSNEARPVDGTATNASENDNRVAKPRSTEDDAPQRETPATVNQAENSATDSAGDGSRRRGRRGGRGRGERVAASASAENEVASIAAQTEAPALVSEDLVAVPPAPTFVAAPAATESLATKPAPWPTPIQLAPAVEVPATALAAIPVEPVVVTSPVVVAVEPVVQLVVTPVTVAVPTPPVDLSANLQQAGLQMIETSTSTAAPVTASAPQQLGRKPKPAAVIINEPLQMVETQHKE